MRRSWFRKCVAQTVLLLHALEPRPDLKRFIHFVLSVLHCNKIIWTKMLDYLRPFKLLLTLTTKLEINIGKKLLTIWYWPITIYYDLTTWFFHEYFCFINEKLCTSMSNLLFSADVNFISNKLWQVSLFLKLHKGLVNGTRTL